MCRSCETEKDIGSFRMRKKLNIPYRQCKDCEKKKLYQWRADNPEKLKAVFDRYYHKNIPYFRERVLIRHARIKERCVGWDSELTDLVTVEYTDLCKRRFTATGFKWHVDHIYPINGETVTGLHVWNNLQVIPATVNLKKGRAEPFLT